ncbi:serine--tRNA ligase [Candidatus Azambacteria bacterium RIFCSPHIGHO2_01_46_10]|uniref:Serine--tRNA ligase n=3 Tax=Candidatus Azamiibacteriota TaxID=1752741 RepID=A0A1F5C8L2_9BACT|nr:MAG: serine--tRNA ligase [Candidatus Azambacteria bacterium RIFCSPHIGHO2_01_46_10]OGD39197.1 MAG: serine--tRNA ligase [Candidatus Azambacteria bacterium RIFCSPLOWO2_01_FULL_46_26]OGD43375.1 MAG: serine--tRNA ligase [Candidatus Azambacteria bacterium RIFCSPLOWO2_02_FULL_46_11]
MINLELLRTSPEKIKEGLKKRNMKLDIEPILELDKKHRELLTQVEQLRHEQNQLSKEIGHVTGEEWTAMIKQMKALKTRLKELGPELGLLEEALRNALQSIPNLPAADAPVGRDESENAVAREVGKKPVFDFKPKDYLTLANGLIDTERSAKVAGSRFAYVFGDLARMEFALVNLAFDTLIPHGFIPVNPPVMIKPKVYEGMGRLAGDQKEERYYLSKDDLYLVGSAEHTIGPIHMDEIFDAADLPRRYVGFSTCFRREAGSYGKDTKGILRVHQFDKVEMFVFSLPENSEEEHRFLLSRQEELMQLLKLPYRVVQICTGDMGFTDAKQYDIETWLPGQNQYRETHSCSNTTDFQARGINAKYRNAAAKKTELVHMLNATGFAIGRVLIAIIENYQQKDGSVKVPDVLQKYLGGLDKIRPFSA